MRGAFGDTNAQTLDGHAVRAAMGRMVAVRWRLPPGCRTARPA